MQGVKFLRGARWGVLAAAGAAVVGLFVGAGAGAMWGVGNPSVGKLKPSSTPVPHFSVGVNAKGQTFGSLLGASNPPDLVQVVATNGQTGYVYYAQLQSSSGGDVTSPQEAVAWDQQLASSAPISIPVYLSDGTTKIGSFLISGGAATQTVIGSNVPGG